MLTVGECPTYVPNVGGESFADAVAANGDMIIANYGTTNHSGYYSLWEKGRMYPISLPSNYDASKYYVELLA